MHRPVHFLGPGMFGRGVLLQGLAAHSRTQARVCKVDVKYSHEHYVALHNQEIQDCRRAIYDPNDPNKATKVVSGGIHVLSVVYDEVCTSGNCSQAFV